MNFKALFLSLVAFLIGVNCVNSACSSEFIAPIVITNNGAIEGMSNANSFMYLGIPYAAPPIKELRWKAPRSAKSWDFLETKALKPACIQLNDCLNGLSSECAKLVSI